MKTYLITLVAGFLLFMGCKTTQTDLNNNSELSVKSGFACGWGSGQDSIEVSQTTVKYTYYVPRKSATPQITKTRPVTADEWTEISNAVDMDIFSKLNYNTCNICVDGCDEWIQIKSNTRSHKITFNKGAKIDSISTLQVKLQALRAEFNPDL